MPLIHCLSVLNNLHADCVITYQVITGSMASSGQPHPALSSWQSEQHCSRHVCHGGWESSTRFESLIGLLLQRATD